jgi:pimeloyl-ACP methyl ester carboxylesterase
MIHIEWRGEPDGPIVIGLHGMPQPPKSLWSCMPMDARVGVVHSPGYGLAPRSSPHNHTAVNVAIEEALGDAPVVIMGMSGGAFRAMELAISGKINLRALVLVGPSLGATDDAERDGLLGLAQALRSGADLREVVSARFLSKGEVGTVEGASVIDWLNATPAEWLAQEIEAMAAVPSVVGVLGAIQVPVHVLVGELDLVTSPVSRDSLVAGLPQCAVQEVPGAGHALTTFHPQRVQEAINQALRAL